MAEERVRTAEPTTSVGPAGSDGDDRRDPARPEATASNATAELEDHVVRLAADLANLRKRYAREIQREREAERGRVALAWLPIVDNLELALRHASDEASPLIDGIRAVYDQAVTELARLGYPRFEDLGRVFTPERHEAVGTVSTEADEGTVVAAARPGYGSSEAILRPAQVVVAGPRADG